MRDPRTDSDEIPTGMVRVECIVEYKGTTYSIGECASVADFLDHGQRQMVMSGAGYALARAMFADDNGRPPDNFREFEEWARKKRRDPKNAWCITEAPEPTPA